jgi:hypothetical protein
MTNTKDSAKLRWWKSNYGVRWKAFHMQKGAIWEDNSDNTE